MTESHTNPDISAEASEAIEEVQQEVTSALSGTTNTTKGSEKPSPAVTDAPHDAGQSTNEPLNDDEGKQNGMGNVMTEAEGGKEKDAKGGEKGAGESVEGQEHERDTTKEGKPAQTGEKRTHPDTPNETKEGDGDAVGAGAKKLKAYDAQTQADESKPEEEEAPPTKGKGGRRKSTRKGTAAAAAATKTNATTDGKKKPVGRPRKNAAPAQIEEKREDGVEKMETVPVASG